MFLKSGVYQNFEAVKVVKFMLKYYNYYGLQKKLSKLYQIDRCEIGRIKNGLRWKDVEV